MDMYFVYRYGETRANVFVSVCMGEIFYMYIRMLRPEKNWGQHIRNLAYYIVFQMHNYRSVGLYRNFFSPISFQYVRVFFLRYK